MLQNDQQMLKEVVNFINAFQIPTRHVSAIGCHLHGFVGALQAIQAILYKTQAIKCE
jgi:hypothetical protein